MTLLVYVAGVVLLSLVFSHPFYLLGLLLAVVGIIIASGNFNGLKLYLLLGAGMVGVIVLVNALFVQAGTTVLFYGAPLPFPGKIRITLEALCFGLGMGARLLVILGAFCFYTTTVHPDKVLMMCSRFGNKSVLAATLSTRLFPLMIRDAQRITGVMRCRGVKMDTGGLTQRVKNRLPVINVMLLSSLERSLQFAESMQARGYGSGERTFFSREMLRPRDYIILSTTVLVLAAGLYAALQGWASYQYYPRLGSIAPDDAKVALLLTLGLLTPAVLNWGWLKYPKFKSKI
ncbi:MAG: energy-coupling factor transporter transmembrane component T [Bacillota bacterium]